MCLCIAPHKNCCLPKLKLGPPGRGQCAAPVITTLAGSNALGATPKGIRAVNHVRLDASACEFFGAAERFGTQI